MVTIESEALVTRFKKLLKVVLLSPKVCCCCLPEFYRVINHHEPFTGPVMNSTPVVVVTFLTYKVLLCAPPRFMDHWPRLLLCPVYVHPSAATVHLVVPSFEQSAIGSRAFLLLPRVPWHTSLSSAARSNLLVPRTSTTTYGPPLFYCFWTFQ